MCACVLFAGACLCAYASACVCALLTALWLRALSKLHIVRKFLEFMKINSLLILQSWKFSKLLNLVIDDFGISWATNFHNWERFTVHFNPGKLLGKLLIFIYSKNLRTIRTLTEISRITVLSIPGLKSTVKRSKLWKLVAYETPNLSVYTKISRITVPQSDEQIICNFEYFCQIGIT